MLVTTKLRIYLILAIIALALKVVIFSSPGWAIFRFPVDQYIQEPYEDDERRVMEDGDESKTSGPPIAMAKRDVADKMMMPPEYKKKEYEMSLKMGLWYFVTCIHRCHDKDNYEEDVRDKVFDDTDIPTHAAEDKDKSSEDEDYHKKRHGHHKHHCAFSTYEHAGRNAYNLEYEMRPARMVYSNMQQVGRYGLMEFRIEAVVGIILSIIGVIFTGLYKKSFGEKRGHGLTACLSLLLSGTLYAVAVGKTLTSICHAKAIMEMNNWETLKMPVPWCLILGAVAALLSLFVGVNHIFVLSRQRSDPNNCYVIKTHHVKGSFPFHTLAPPGYEPKLSLLNPPEEAGPLPEKPAI